MPDLALTVANRLANVGNVALILGALLVLIGTWLTIWAGGTKERFADERITGNERLTETAKADAAKAVEETEKVRETNLRLSIQLESEKSARLKIEQGLASRSVSPDKRPLLVDAIKKIQPPLSVRVERLVGDTEARQFGDQLIECFRLAGIQPNDATIDISPGFPDGLTIVSPEAPDENKLALALQAVGFSPTVIQRTVPQGVSDVVLVGLKPPSFLNGRALRLSFRAQTAASTALSNRPHAPLSFSASDFPMLKPFEAAAAKTARARRHLQELKSEIDGFFRSGGASVVYEMAEEYCVKIPGTAAFTYRQSKPVPLEWSAIIGDILHNLRSSLDLVACDVHLISGGKPKDTDNVHYPFCHTKAELPEMIRRRRLSHIGSESRSIIESTAPYRGGNEGLKLDFVRNLGSPSAGTAPREVSQLIAWRGLACPAWRACVA